MRDRSYRRAQYGRAKRRVQRRQPWVFIAFNDCEISPASLEGRDNDVALWNIRRLGMTAATPVPCSRPQCCGNPRGIGMLPMQERRALSVREAELAEAA